MHKTKKQIIYVALKLFAKKGYEKATIEDIISSIGLSKGGVYHHFKSKEAISDTIIQLYFDSVQEYYDENINDRLNSLDKLKILLRSKYHVMKEDEDGLRAVFLNPKQITIRSKVQQMNRKHFGPLLVSLLGEGKKYGDFKLRSPEVVAHLIFSLQETFLSIPLEVVKNAKKIQLYHDEVNRSTAHLIGVDEKLLKI
jgi:TetR/AcrR family transcriptional regulator, transcriptional repressor for nem operon